MPAILPGWAACHFFLDPNFLIPHNILLQRAVTCPERHEIVEGNFRVEKVPQVTRNVSEPREKVV